MSECSRCGICCTKKVYVVPHRIRTLDEQRYNEYRGIEIERINRNQDYEIIPCRCKHLTDDNLCDIWDTRPDICRQDKRGNIKIWIPKGCTGENK